MSAHAVFLLGLIVSFGRSMNERPNGRGRIPWRTRLPTPKFALSGLCCGLHQLKSAATPILATSLLHCRRSSRRCSLQSVLCLHMILPLLLVASWDIEIGLHRSGARNVWRRRGPRVRRTRVRPGGRSLFLCDRRPLLLLLRG